MAAATRTGAPVALARAAGQAVGGAASSGLAARVVPRRIPRRGDGRAPGRTPLRPPPPWSPHPPHHYYPLILRSDERLAPGWCHISDCSGSFKCAHVIEVFQPLVLASRVASTIQAVRFQLLHAPPQIIHFAGDLKYAVGDIAAGEKEVAAIEDLQQQFSNRPIWMAASIHKGEDEIILRVHDELTRAYPTLLLILVPRHPEDSKNVSQTLKKQKVNFVLRSTREVVSSNTSIYVVDTLGELRMLYRVTPIAVIGGSFLPGLAGHNISEAAAVGCAVMTGPSVGHFYHMLVEMWQINPLAVKQVKGEYELLEALKQLLGDSRALEACQRAAKDAFSFMSDGVVNRVWNLVHPFTIGSQTDTCDSFSSS
nr:probable 3-deoxy-D-manno-octulosonic acid transferase, mitochondrial isoform X5 [Oryza sativa Japonica Group]